MTVNSNSREELEEYGDGPTAQPAEVSPNDTAHLASHSTARPNVVPIARGAGSNANPVSRIAER